MTPIISGPNFLFSDHWTRSNSQKHFQCEHTDKRFCQGTFLVKYYLYIHVLIFLAIFIIHYLFISANLTCLLSWPSRCTIIDPGLNQDRPPDKCAYWKIIFFILIQIICCGYSKEPSQWDGSFEHPKHVLKLMGKKIFTILRWKFLFI